MAEKSRASNPDSLRAVARQMLARHLPREKTVGALTGALVSVIRELQAELVPVLGALGVRMILSHAIRRSSERYPFLSQIAVFEDGVEASTLLREAPGLDYGTARSGIEALLAALLQLLAELVGKDLALLLAYRPLQTTMGPARTVPASEEEAGPSAPSDAQADAKARRTGSEHLGDASAEGER